MSIHKRDFSPEQRSDIEAVASRLCTTFDVVIRMAIDFGLPRVVAVYQEPLDGGTIGGSCLSVSSPNLKVEAEIKKINPEEMGYGEGKPEKRKRTRREPVPIPEPPEAIDSPELRAFLPEFESYRKTIKKPFRTQAQWDYLFKHLAACAGREHAVLALKYARAHAWMVMEERYKGGKSWREIASELGLNLEAAKPAPTPTDLAARDLERAKAHAWEEIPKRIAPNTDGWTGYSRSLLFDGLDACKSEAEVQAHLEACRAVCDRLRAAGAYPLRRATKPGEILSAAGMAIVVDLKGDDPVAVKAKLKESEKQRAAVADRQHAYAHDPMTGKCAWCQQGQDHIRHYQPRELPFCETRHEEES